MAIGVLIATSLSGATGRLRSPAVQWLLIALVAFEYWDAPIRLTSLDHPAVYRALAAAAPGAVCEAPFGIGDGLSVGLGSQERRVLFYATLHEHPLAGGFVGANAGGCSGRYGKSPITATLLRFVRGAAAQRSSTAHRRRQATRPSTRCPSSLPDRSRLEFGALRPTSHSCQPTTSHLTKSVILPATLTRLGTG
jgi:hypothetical protein